MLEIDGAYLAGQPPIKKMMTFVLENFEKPAVKHSKNKITLLNFIY